uniref:Glycine-rich cell wall structural protein n=1 Tax=Panagrellus redivivus TaxID=6233 RepID=A0A7E4W1N4_PANRE
MTVSSVYLNLCVVFLLIATTLAQFMGGFGGPMGGFGGPMGGFGGPMGGFGGPGFGYGGGSPFGFGGLFSNLLFG